MSTLLKALRRADQPQFTPHMPLMGLPVSQEEEPDRRWIWWLLAPLALIMGAAANYGWHLYHLKPIEQQIEVKEVVTPPFVRVEPRPMITRPLPPPLPEPVVQPKAVAAAPATATASNGNGTQSLAERIMMALNNTPLVEETAPQAQPQAGQHALAQEGVVVGDQRGGQLDLFAFGAAVAAQRELSAHHIGGDQRQRAQLGQLSGHAVGIGIGPGGAGQVAHRAHVAGHQLLRRLGQDAHRDVHVVAQVVHPVLEHHVQHDAGVGALEVDQPVGLLVAAADVAGGDATGVVASAGLRLGHHQRLLGGRAGDFGEVAHARAATARGGRLVLANSHESVSSSLRRRPSRRCRCAGRRPPSRWPAWCRGACPSRPACGASCPLC